jgi:hypothetical protein
LPEKTKLDPKVICYQAAYLRIDFNDERLRLAIVKHYKGVERDKMVMLTLEYFPIWPGNRLHTLANRLSTLASRLNQLCRESSLSAFF